jgi:hypothetical protein
LISGFIIGGIKNAAKKVSADDITAYYAMSFLSSAVITVTNSVTPALIRALAFLQGGDTIAEMNVTLIFNLSVLRFANTAVIPYFVADKNNFAAVAFDGFSTLIFVAIAPLITLATDYVFEILK